MIDEIFERLRSEIASLFEDLHGLIADIKNPTLEEVIRDIRKNVSEPFLFVVVGEIKAGKSSFINALLRADVCAVDPAPCTDVIQQLVYSPEKQQIDVNPYLKRIGLPVDILKQIAIVDTPGTNTVVHHHHEITERFIPNSGLVLFVFPAKNPHTRSAWDLLDYIAEQWRKRVVFVLQQADLATEKELRVNRQKVEEYAVEHGIKQPVIFITSAKWEQENDPRGGFEDIRRFIRETVTGGRHLFLKLKTDLETAESVLKKLYHALSALKQELEADKGVVDRIKQRLRSAREDSNREVQYLVDRMLEHYDQAAEQITADLMEGLSAPALFARAIRSTFSRHFSIKEWLQSTRQRFEEHMATSLDQIAGDGAVRFMVFFSNLSDSLIKEFSVEGSGENRDFALFADIEDDRQDVIAEIRIKIQEAATLNPVDETLAVDPAGMSSNLISGSALTLIGAVILLTTHVTVLDITGGILTGVGMLMAGGVLVVKKGKIVRELNRSLREGRLRLKEALAEKLDQKIDGMHERLHRRVSPFFENVSDREKKIGPLMDRGEQVQKRLLELMRRIDSEIPP